MLETAAMRSSIWLSEQMDAKVFLILWGYNKTEKFDEFDSAP